MSETQENQEKVFSLYVDRLIAKKNGYNELIKKQTDALKAAENPTEKRMHKIMESCPTKMAFSFVGGFGMGAIFGLFTASVDPQYNFNSSRIPTMKEMAVDMGKRAYSTGKNFALLGKTDLWNGTLSGFSTGAVLGLRAGLKPGIYGGIGFAIFSALIESVLMSRGFH